MLSAMASLDEHAVTNPRQNESSPESSTNTVTPGRLPKALRGAQPNESIASEDSSSRAKGVLFEVLLDLVTRSRTNTHH
jgi:hypothetical protein